MSASIFRPDSREKSESLYECTQAVRPDRDLGLCLPRKAPRAPAFAAFGHSRCRPRVALNASPPPQSAPAPPPTLQAPLPPPHARAPPQLPYLIVSALAPRALLKPHGSIAPRVEDDSTSSSRNVRWAKNPRRVFAFFLECCVLLLLLLLGL